MWNICRICLCHFLVHDSTETLLVRISQSQLFRVMICRLRLNRCACTSSNRNEHVEDKSQMKRHRTMIDRQLNYGTIARLLSDEMNPAQMTVRWMIVALTDRKISVRISTDKWNSRRISQETIKALSSKTSLDSTTSKSIDMCANMAMLFHCVSRFQKEIFVYRFLLTTSTSIYFEYIVSIVKAMLVNRTDYIHNDVVRHIRENMSEGTAAVRYTYSVNLFWHDKILHCKTMLTSFMNIEVWSSLNNDWMRQMWVLLIEIEIVFNRRWHAEINGIYINENVSFDWQKRVEEEPNKTHELITSD
jgi:hypothetical protein